MSEFQLIDAKKGDVLKIVRIDGGESVKSELKDKGIVENSIVEVVSKGLEDKEGEPLMVEVDGREMVLPRGIAKKIKVGDKSLSDLKVGDEGVVTDLSELNKNSIGALKMIGVSKDVNIKLKGHGDDKSYLFKIDNKDVELGTGQAAKIMVDKNGKAYQAISCKEEGVICGYMGGTSFLNKLKEKIGDEDIIGKKIVLVSEKPCTYESTGEGEFMVLKIDDKEVSIGKGKAEKIWVELSV
ncbi:FeoA domain-containing protein [Methanothermococcus okinawensis]|uniref:FeoA family protein n=1 Tax=Methanothermococcus okinawensis (strain DSM 14208 / JCM 11175 / IH1) TaxID=647113 RepID=F8AK92_METOI|nr:FeoA domain-containing protein [Methanothermococcus okinawensis]AEH07465.1 FeoA family protein [Methanothermococcus okinawensis IH1]